MLKTIFERMTSGGTVASRESPKKEDAEDEPPVLDMSRQNSPNDDEAESSPSMWRARAEPHMPELEYFPVPDEKKELWKRLGGTELDPILDNGAMVLLSTDWLVEQAESGGILMPRQALPPAAFVPPCRVRAATVKDERSGVESLKIASISHCWLQADHPDPRGHDLRILSRVFRLLAADEFSLFHGCWALFYDFCVVHQCCRDREGVPQQRTYRWLCESECFVDGAIGRFDSEDALFKQALGGLGTVYSHPKLFVFMLTMLPADYNDPTKYTRSGNTAEFFDRGWCFCESSWSFLTKPSFRVLNLGQSTGEEDSYFQNGRGSQEASLVRTCARGRKPPLLPEAFVVELESKGYMNGKDDRPRHADWYGSVFCQRMQSAEVLDYRNLDWGDEDVQQVAAVLASGATPRLQRLSLAYNSVGNAGVARLAEALRAPGALPELRRLDLSSNRVGDAGAAVLAEAFQGMPELQELYLSSNCIGDEGAARLAKACQAPGAVPKLEILHLAETAIGDNGARAVAAATSKLDSLKHLHLEGNCIGIECKRELLDHWDEDSTALYL